MKEKRTRIKPFIIGLTGTIGTGKSLVRKMLEHKGALTIDADRLAHGAYAAGTKGFHELVQIFGDEILDREGQIDRKRLGEMVFKNSRALQQLESLIHPLVTKAIERVIKLSPLPIIVIEAIKLLESDLYEQCNIIWEVTSHPEDIYWRLSRSRGMSRAHVDERLSQQNFLKSDKSLIDITILNQGDIQALWENVSKIWNDLAIRLVFFHHALSETGELLQPFQKNLIQQYSALQDHAISEIHRRGLFFLPMRYLNFKGSYFPEENSKPAYLKENIINFFLWQTVEKNGKAQYYISDIDNFSASVAANLQQFDFEDFIKSIGHLQEFFSLHLCEKVYFPFNSDTLPLCEELGFGKTDSGSPKDIELSPLGYNLLYKQLRPPLDLFSEK